VSKRIVKSEKLKVESDGGYDQKDLSGSAVREASSMERSPRRLWLLAMTLIRLCEERSNEAISLFPLYMTA
jgi:hypothetical protein